MHPNLMDAVREINRLLLKVNGDRTKNKNGRSKLRQSEILTALGKANVALESFIRDTSFFTSLDRIPALPDNLQSLNPTFFNVESVLFEDAGISGNLKESLIRLIRNVRNQEDSLPSTGTTFSTALMHSAQESNNLIVDLIARLKSSPSEKDRVQRLMREVFKVVGGVSISVVNIANLNGSTDTAKLSVVAGSAVIGNGNRGIQTGM